ncbi:tRNA lysidine(34) synthetase TilS [Kiloniella antarctica]|uniref:tRNA(Ile)-lysidine synthase n=1 Tax=Kiloniella antarctica TaxID=1550907 RepID=A0ABW5BEY5_9PROT
MIDGKSTLLPREGPLNGEEFAGLMSAFTFPRAPLRLGLAVSGGADSMALCLLLKEWIDAQGGNLFAVTVDHGLRSESEFEASWVGARLAFEGIEHQILNWEREPGAKGSIQVQAREGRYQAIAKWCEANEISYLALGHHHDDQIETFLMRLLRQSGADGLAGMSALRQDDGGLSFVRPLLSIPKNRLLETLRNRGWGWIEEPSNHKGDYLRNRLRQHLPVMERQGLKGTALTRINRNLGRIRRNLEIRTNNFIDRCVIINSVGFAEIDISESTTTNRDILARALEKVLMTIGGGNYSPGLVKVDRLVEDLLSGSEVKSTLSGCQIIGSIEKITVVRETRKLPQISLKSDSEFLWDNRFYVHIHKAMEDKGLVLQALGERGWQKLCEANPLLKKTGVPFDARYSLPAIFLGDKIITVPHLEYLDPAWIDKLPIKIRFNPKNKLIQHAFTVA